jgi:hypothetical protein
MLVYDDYFDLSILEFDEDDITENLMNSEKFKMFYGIERGRAPEKIHWRLVFGMYPDQMMSHVDNRNSYKIYIKQFPLHIEDSCLIAHEIMHLVFKHSGDSVDLWFRNGSPGGKFAKVLASMFEDPIINSYLEREYGFNISDEYNKDLAWSKNEHSTRHEETTSEMDNLLYALDISYQDLKWNRISDKEGWLEFKKSLKEWYPKAFARSEEILAIVEQYGSETIEESRISAQKIIEKYNLGKIVSFDPREL